MRSFGARADCHVSDEPLYGHYLLKTGLPHPDADEVIRSQPNDWRDVASELTGSLPADKSLWYQKHMSHHLLPNISRIWLEQLTNVFLIREPRAMLASLIAVLGEVTLQDTGLPQQVELFCSEKQRIGTTPVVVDAKELLLDPEGVLREICLRVGISYDPAMLSWAPGSRETDGCWGKHWYANTNDSEGFAKYQERDVVLPARYEELAMQCEALYIELAIHRIRANADSEVEAKSNAKNVRSN
jgi:hypothetical protein